MPIRVGVKLEDFSEDDETDDWPFREILSSLMWLSISTRPDSSNAVRSVARYSLAPKAVHWKAALSIFAYINSTSCFSITYQRGTAASISLDVFADADYASKATDRGSVSAEQLCVLGHICV